MTENLSDRIEIINSYRLLIGSKNKSTKSRIRINYFFGGIMLAGLIFALVIIFYAAIAGLLSIETRINWTKSTLIVISSISLVYDLANRLNSIILLKHLQNIEEAQNRTIETHLNVDLENTISKLNEPEKNILVIVLGALILLSAVLQQLDYPQYWDFFKIPILLFFVLKGIETVQNLSKLKSNISKSENQLLSPDLQTNPV